jgi:hypothetical protein
MTGHGIDQPNILKENRFTTLDPTQLTPIIGRFRSGEIVIKRVQNH